MQARISLLMFLAHYTFNQIELGAKIYEEWSIYKLLRYCAEKAVDKDWFAEVAQSYRATFLHPSLGLKLNQELKNILLKWLATEFEKFSIIRAQGDFGTNEGTRPRHYVDFAYHFLFQEKDTDPGRQRTDASYKQKMQAYLRQHTKKRSSITGLRLGDIIIYNHPFYGDTHMAVFIGKRGDMDYVVSKWGPKLGVYLHPLDAVPEDYGSARASYHDENFQAGMILDKFIGLQMQLGKNEGRSLGSAARIIREDEDSPDLKHYCCIS